MTAALSAGLDRQELPKQERIAEANGELPGRLKVTRLRYPPEAHEL